MPEMTDEDLQREKAYFAEVAATEARMLKAWHARYSEVVKNDQALGIGPDPVGYGWMRSRGD